MIYILIYYFSRYWIPSGNCMQLWSPSSKYPAYFCVRTISTSWLLLQYVVSTVSTCCFLFQYDFLLLLAICPRRLILYPLPSAPSSAALSATFTPSSLSSSPSSSSPSLSEFKKRWLCVPSTSASMEVLSQSKSSKSFVLLVVK